MRSWLLAIIVLVGLGLLIAWREARLGGQITALRQSTEELAAHQQSTLERLDRIEAKLAEADQVSPPGTVSTEGRGNAQVLQRLTALENQIRALHGRLSPQYDPTSAPEPEPDTNAPPKRGWGPEQVLGPPDTDREADAVTAWTSLETDAGPEWLAVGFNQTVDLAQVRIRESFNAGAIVKVTARVSGGEVVLWGGNSARGKAPRDFVVNAAPGVQVNSVIIYLDTQRVPGWNEIDAVELVGRDGSRQWAVTASASSTYADRAASAATTRFNGFLELSK